MIALTFSERAHRAVLDSLRRPYPSGLVHGELAVERDVRSGECLVMTDVPTGLSATMIMNRVAQDVRDGLVSQLRAIHDESPESGPTKVVFTPAPDANLARLESDLHHTFERARASADATFARVTGALAAQGSEVSLSADDWFVVHDVLTDARIRWPGDDALAAAARAVAASLFGDDDDT